MNCLKDSGQFATISDIVWNNIKKMANGRVQRIKNKSSKATEKGTLNEGCSHNFVHFARGGRICADIAREYEAKGWGE